MDVKNFLLPILLASTAPSPPDGMAQARRPPAPAHIVVIGIDALSTDGLQFSRTPNLDTLIRRGAVSLTTRGVMPTVSAPNWSSMLLGAGPEQHGITKNGWTLPTRTIDPASADADGFFPSVFSVIGEQMPAARTGMFYDWDELANFFNLKTIDTAVYSPGKDYRAVVRNATGYITSARPLFTFIYLGHPDNVSHESGHGTEAYRSSIGDVDRELGRLFGAMKGAGMFDSTVFFVVSDHGGVGHGHGGESMAEIEVPWIVSGRGVAPDRLLTGPNDNVNTAPTIAWLLGLEPPDAWVGRAVTRAFDPSGAGPPYVPRPRCTVASGVYLEPQTVELVSTERGASVRYTTDGSQPGLGSPIYRGPFTVESTLTVRAVAVDRGGVSGVTRSDIRIVRGVRAVELPAPPAAKYAAEGAFTLIDGIAGSGKFNDGRWLGYEGNDLEVVFDFGGPRKIDSVSVGCLNDTTSWIFLPAGAGAYGSADGTSFVALTEVSSVPAGLDPEERGRQSFTMSLPDFTDRYLKVVVRNTGACPAGHSAEGKNAWLFVDEITAR